MSVLETFGILDYELKEKSSTMSQTVESNVQNETELFSRVTFNDNVAKIYAKSMKIGDNFQLLRFSESDEEIVYLEKKDQRMFTKSDGCDIYTCVYNVIFSDSFTCPVLYLNVHKSNGRLLTYEEIYEFFHLHNDKSDNLVLTQQDHPYTNKPFYYLHPCKTNDLMIATRMSSSSERAINLTLKWLSFTFAALGIPLSLDYALDKHQ